MAAGLDRGAPCLPTIRGSGAMGWSGRVACKCDMFGVPDVGNGVLLSLGGRGLLGLRRLFVH